MNGLFTAGRFLNYAPSMRRFLTLMILLSMHGITAVCAEEPPGADQVLASAKAQATEQHKDIFLVFRASWCQPCKELETFLEDSEVRPILEKYFVIAALNVEESRGKHPELENPGAEKLVSDFGDASGGVPFIVFLDEQGQLLVNSNRPAKGKPNGENVGYPAVPKEID